MKKHLFILFFTVVFTNVNSQNLLNLGYNYGTLPTNINQTDITSAYTSWKNTFTESCGDNKIRVNFDKETQTVSEGIGYGMLIASFAGDQDLLDGLWNYYTNFLNNNGVMHWKIEGCSSVLGENGATDAELDVAMALIIAHKKWGSKGNINYKDDVISFINVIKKHEIEADTNVLKPGDAWGGSSVTNISYFAPGYYSAYKDITEDSDWDAITDKSYEIINANLAATNAVHNLVSDWCKADGNFSSEVSWAVNEGKKYGYDASRTPWRVTLDYLWTGSTDALAYANKCIDFIDSKDGLDNIYPGYNLDGTPYITSYKDVTFTGAYAVAVMASNNQTLVNNAYTKVVEMTTDAYFGSTLRVLYLLTLSGNFYSANKFTTTLNNTDYKNDVKTLIISPNPTDDFLNISQIENIKNIIIFNTNGKKVYQKTYNNINTTKIDISNLNSGLHIVEINDVKYKFIKK